MAEIDDLFKEIEDYKASRFSISSLPSELLMIIFRYIEVIEDTYPALEYTLPIFGLFPVCKRFNNLGWRSLENRFIDDKYMIWRILWRNPPEDVLRKMVHIQTLDMTTRSSDVFTYACGAGYSEFVESLLQHPQVNPNMFGNEALKNASANGHVEVVKLLLADERVNPPDSEENSAIRSASKEGQVSVVKLLLEDHRVNPSDNGNEAIISASSNGHVGVVKVLLSDKRVDAGVKQNISFRKASRNGHLEVVKALLSNRKVNPASENNEAIREATVYGHVEVVEVLLSDKRVDPSAWENMAVRKAAERGHLRLLKILMDDDRVNPADLGNESLKRASQEGLMEVVKVLLDDYRVIFAEGLKDAAEAASKKGFLEIAELITKREKNRELFKEAKELFSRIKERLSKEMKSFTTGASSIVKMRAIVQSLCEEKAKLMKGLDTDDLPERMKILNDELEKELSSIREIGVFGRETHIYFGEILNDRPHGKGKIYVEKKGARLGSLSAKIRVVYDGEFVNGHRHGHGIEYHEKGKHAGTKRYEGEWSKGRKEGQGTEYHPSQRKLYEGGWKGGKRNGHGTLYPKKSSKKQGKGDGIMKGVWRSGNLYKIDIDSVKIAEIDFTRLSKFFKRKRKIGQGAFGEVFRVMWKGKKAAAKVLNVSSQFRSAVLERTEETLKLCASLHHPQIIKIYGWSKKGEIGYLMELCTNSVADLIQPVDISQRLDINLKVQYIYQTALGMNYLHEHSIMHRDLKWENILLSQDGDIRITDFDFAMDEMWQSSVNMSSVGTPAFIAPEVVKGEDYSNKCDVYSFALMIYCLLFETLMPYQDLKQCNCGMSQFSSHTFLQHVCNCNLRPPIPGPAGMPEDTKWKWLIDLMMVCWDTKVSKRPDFKQIVGIIESNMKDQKLFMLINVRTTDNVDSEAEKFLLTTITLDGLRNSVERRWEDVDTIFVQTSSVGLVEMRNDEQVKRLDPDALLVVKLLKMEEEEVTTESLSKRIEELEKDNEMFKKRVLDLKEDNDKLKKENFELRMLVRGQEKEVMTYKDEATYLRDLNDKLVKILQEQKDQSEAGTEKNKNEMKEKKKVLVAHGYNDNEKDEKEEEEEEEEKEEEEEEEKEE